MFMSSDATLTFVHYWLLLFLELVPTFRTNFFHHLSHLLVVLFHRSFPHSIFCDYPVLIQLLFLLLIYNRVVWVVTHFRRNLLSCDEIQKSTTNEGFLKRTYKKWYVNVATYHFFHITSSSRIPLQLRWSQALWQTPSIAYYPAFLVYYPISAWIIASFLVC